LRIELSSELWLLLPFNQFLQAELKIENKEHHLRLVFAMNEVLVSGKNLKRVLIAMQKRNLPSSRKCRPTISFRPLMARP
jgi:hypothetical protein